MVCRALDPENASEVDWEALVSVSGGSVLFGVSFARGLTWRLAQAVFPLGLLRNVWQPC